MNRSRRPRSSRLTPSPRRVLPQFQLRPQWWNWTGLNRAIDRRIRSHHEETVTTQQVLGLRAFWFDGFFASLSDNLLVSFLPLFALAYGASNGRIGLLSSVANLLAVIALFPGAAHADRTLHRKRLVLWTGGVAGRSLIAFLVLLPLVPMPATLAIWSVILINSARNFLGSYANPAWTGLVADLVPPRRRSRYFADRNFTMGFAALMVTLAGGLAITRLAPATNGGLLGYQVVFLAALLFGAASTISFSRIPEDACQPSDTPSEHRQSMAHILRSHPEYAAFLAGAFIWNISIQMAGPFFNVYLVNELGGSAATVGTAAGIMTATGLLGSVVFGRVGDRKGNLTVVIYTGLMIPLLPILWAVSAAPWHVFLVVAFGGFAWAGYNLANFNLLLELAPQQARSRAVALYQATVFAAAVAGPLVGGALIDLFSYRSVFIGTAVGRWIAVGLFLVLIRKARLSRRP